MKTKKTSRKGSPRSTGTYVYDKDGDRIVKVSDSIPRVASKGSGPAEAGPCGRTPCGGGSCAMD